MNGLPILLRLAERRAEDLRLELAEAVARQQAAAEALARQDALLAAEAAARGTDPESLRDWAAWRGQAGRARQALARAAAAADAEEAARRDAMREGIADAKRLEIALEAQHLAARRKLARKREAEAEDTELRRARG